MVTQLEKTVTHIPNGLLPHGLYFHRRDFSFPPSIAETNGQHFNFEPFIWVVAAFALSEFLKGFLGTLGTKFAEYVSKKKREGAKQEELCVREMIIVLQRDLDSIHMIGLDRKTLDQQVVEGFEAMKRYLISVGLPNYRADAVLALLRDDLINLLDKDRKSRTDSNQDKGEPTHT